MEIVMRFNAFFKFFVFITGALVLPSSYADTVKVGIIAPMSGPFSQVGKYWSESVQAFQKLHGKTVAGHTIEIVYRDLPEVNPAQAKALAQELIIKEKVQYLGGLYFTPDAIAVGQIAEQAKIPTIIFNAATSSILDKSQYLLRTSYTLPQVTVPVARYAIEKGIKKVALIISDYAPGHDSEKAFIEAFVNGGGTIVEKIRVPLKTTDFGPYMQTAKLAKPDAIFVFMPGGPPTYGVVKAYNDNGLKAAGIKFLGTGETLESDLPALGDGAIGIETGLHYSPMHPSPKNEAFVKAVHDLFPKTVITTINVPAYDGMYVISRMVESTNGQRNGEKAIAAAKGLKWESPRGPVQISPQSRELIQNVYIRVVDRDKNGTLVNREFMQYDNQPDYGRASNKEVVK